MSLFYDRKFDVVTEPMDDALKLGYRSSHTLALNAVGKGTDVLDLACGKGRMVKELARNGCRVTGLDRLELPMERPGNRGGIYSLGSERQGVSRGCFAL